MAGKHDLDNPKENGQQVSGFDFWNSERGKKNMDIIILVKT